MLKIAKNIVNHSNILHTINNIYHNISQFLELTNALNINWSIIATISKTFKIHSGVH